MVGKGAIQDANLAYLPNGNTVRLMPKLWLTSFPKSGTHLFELVLETFLKPGSKYWLGTFSHNSWGVGWKNLHIVDRAMAALTPHHYIKGHVGYRPDIEAAAYKSATSMIFAYRDLRDVAVSQAFHIMSEDERRYRHPGKAAYQKLGGFEEVLLAVIEGLPPYGGLFERFDLYAPWLDRDWVCKVRYEDMRTNRDRAKQIERLIVYVCRMAALAQGVKNYQLDQRAIRALAQKAVQRSRETKRSLTFRKGKSGGWREHFTPQVRDTFKALDPGYLVRLGYESEYDW